MSGIKTAVITGPTGTGKTRLAIELARSLGGEIVSADSMQVYRGMDIGTAKPDAYEQRSAVHHMIDVAQPDESYSAALYAQQAAGCVEDIASRGRLPIIAGGTGLYIEALLYGRSYAAAPAPELRAELERRYDETGGEAMLAELSRFDPRRAAKLHPNDKKRIVRAFEVYRLTGRPISEYDERTASQPPRFDCAKIVLTYARREKLYQRTDERVERMFELGLESEVRGLLERGICPEKHTSMQAIGYKETVMALRGEISMDEAKERIKRETRRYAKRQLTWLRREKNICLIEWDEAPDIDAGRRISTEFLLKNGIIAP